MQAEGNFCTIQGHDNSAILAVCTYEHCKKQRAICFFCMQQNQHLAHNNEVKQLTNMEGFLTPKRQKYNEMITRVDQLSQQFNASVTSLKKVLNDQLQPPPNNFNNLGNKQIGESVSRMLQYDYAEKLIKDRLDNIFVNTINQIRTTCQDLSSLEDKQCYELLQQDKSKEARALIDQQLVKNPKNTFLLLAKGDALFKDGLAFDAAEVYTKVLNIEPNNPWATIGKEKAMQQYK